MAPTAGQEQREHQEGLQVTWQHRDLSLPSSGLAQEAAAEEKRAGQQVAGGAAARNPQQGAGVLSRGGAGGGSEARGSR